MFLAKVLYLMTFFKINLRKLYTGEFWFVVLSLYLELPYPKNSFSLFASLLCSLTLVQ